MQTLLQTLKESEESVLTTIADAWGIGPLPNNEETRLTFLESHMLTPEQAEKMWHKLSDQERGALQTLLGSGGKMPIGMFKHMFGDFRRMGLGQVEREQPHKRGQTIAETLFYRGFIGEVIQMTDAGAEASVFVPDDLARILPREKTGYNLQVSDDDILQALSTLEIGTTQKADTSIVDDMTTLLAFIRLYAPPLVGDSLAEGSVKALMPYLLVKDARRVPFMVSIAKDANLIFEKNDCAYVQTREAPSWLKANRSEQVKLLVNAWRNSITYRELYHVNGLKVEQTDNYQPPLARKTLLGLLKNNVPDNGWWDLDEFIYKIKQHDPDFQRINADYDGWYIVDMEGEYAKGFESWDTVEGAQLEFIITGPLYWLGLVDIAPDAARLTAYGRGIVGMSAYPTPQDTPEPIVMTDDGKLFVSRKVSRVDRFQVARFTTWETVHALGEEKPFEYALNGRGIKRADEQGITTDHIRKFLTRVLEDEPIPDSIAHLLDQWQSGDGAMVSLEEAVILRTTHEDTLNLIMNTPELRRFMGAKLGANTAIVRKHQWEDLQNALLEMGISVELN